MSKAIPLLFFVLSLFCLCPSASALPQQHEVWHQGNDAYRTMYDRYEIGLQRAFDALSEETYKKLEKENDAAIDESVKQAGAAGENAALACAQALAERILIMEDLVSKADSERAAGSPNPLEGFYHLAGRQGDDGYLTIGRDGNGGYCLEMRGRLCGAGRPGAGGGPHPVRGTRRHPAGNGAGSARPAGRGSACDRGAGGRGHEPGARNRFH